MPKTAIALFSGGLDSTLAIRLMQVQGINVHALHFTSPFFGVSPESDSGKYDARRAAEALKVPLTIHQLGEEYLEMLRNPSHGYGKAINPCIDCHIYFLKKAGELMRTLGADFVITGEVMGQRPMSQRKDALKTVERDCGLEGLLLRPLSARFLDLTIPEKEGWVNRDQLPQVKGRSRKDQFRLAAELGVREYPTPAGGCLLTELSYESKVRDIFSHREKLVSRDFRLLRVGRHFRLDEQTKVIIGRNAAENDLITGMKESSETLIRWEGGSSPTGLICGPASAKTIATAAAILLRYTKAEKAAACLIAVFHGAGQETVSVTNSMDEASVEKFRV
jgi:tRNA U34 2-thiouridine synthase MnmA/TrmU